MVRQSRMYDEDRAVEERYHSLPGPQSPADDTTRRSPLYDAKTVAVADILDEIPRHS